MEIIGRPGGTAWVKATIKVIQINEEGASYFVQLEPDGDLHEIREENIIAAAPEIIREPVAVPEEDPEPKLTPEEKTGAAPAEKKRGRPRKATVEDLIQRAEGKQPQ